MDKKYIKRWEKIRSIGKRRYALLHGIQFGAIYFLVQLVVILLREYIPTEKVSFTEQVVFIIQKHAYIFIGFIIFFVVHALSAHFTWERNQNEYNRIILDSGTDEIKGGSVLAYNKKTIVYILGVAIVVLLFIYLNNSILPYRDSTILMGEVENYLSNKYDEDFIVMDDITRNGPWYYVSCYPKTDVDIRFIVVWHKGKPEKATDTYINSRLKYPDELKLIQYIRETLGYDTLMYFEFYLTDIRNDMKDMENQDILEKYKDKLYIDVQCHTFVNELNPKEEIDRAYSMLENYFYDKFGDWNLHIYFYSENYKNVLTQQYEENNNFFKTMDTATANRLYKEGQLINALHLCPGIANEQAMDHYYYR